MREFSAGLCAVPSQENCSIQQVVDSKDLLQALTISSESCAIDSGGENW